MWEDVVKALPLGLIVLDEGEKVIYINRPAEKILDIRQDKAAGRPGREVLGTTALSQFLGREKQSGINQVNLGDRPVIVQFAPISGQQGSTAIWIFDYRNWDVLCRELADLKEAKDNLDAIFSSSYDEIYITDGRGITLWLNNMGKKNHGVVAEELIGKHVEELERAGYFPPLVTKYVLKEKRKVTLPQKTRDGKQVIVTGNPLLNESGEIIRVVINSRDISELINLQLKLEETENLIENYRQLIMRLRQEKMKDKEVPVVSPQMKRIIETADKVSQADSTVLITGESGVGKGVLASRIHNLSRPGGPFVLINCGAIPENLLESELFGYEGGAFTNARKEGKKGLIELANGGTVFLDEIADLPLSLQVKLLQVLQERKLIRVGGNKQIDVDVRFIAATNRDIKKMVADGLFREDLFYRLNVIPVTIPPLRHRREDIPPLISHFLSRLNQKYETNKKFSPATMEILLNYHWPGNVREVENIVERLVVTSEVNEILPSHLPDYVVEDKKDTQGRIYVRELYPLKEAIAELEKQMFSLAYQRLKNTYKIADALGISQSTAVRRLLKYRLGQENGRQRPLKKGRKKLSGSHHI